MTTKREHPVAVTSTRCQSHCTKKRIEFQHNKCMRLHALLLPNMLLARERLRALFF